jgi:hypothetical protein
MTTNDPFLGQKQADFDLKYRVSLLEIFTCLVHAFFYLAVIIAAVILCYLSTIYIW